MGTRESKKILRASGTELARMIRDGELTSRQAVEEHIEQIQRVNPTLNAVVRERFDEALSEADAADAAAGAPLVAVCAAAGEAAVSTRLRVRRP